MGDWKAFFYTLLAQSASFGIPCRCPNFSTAPSQSFLKAALACNEGHRHIVPLSIEYGVYYWGYIGIMEKKLETTTL